MSVYLDGEKHYGSFLFMYDADGVGEQVTSGMEKTWYEFVDADAVHRLVQEAGNKLERCTLKCEKSSNFMFCSIKSLLESSQGKLNVLVELAEDYTKAMNAKVCSFL